MMEALMVYLLKSALVAAVFYGIYWFFLKKETFYRFNRHFLLAGLLASVIMPFVKYSYEVVIQIQTALLPRVSDIELKKTPQVLALWLEIMLGLYLLVGLFFIARHMAGLFRIKQMVLRYGYTLFEGYKVISTPVFKSSFSVFNYIFIDISTETSEAEKQLIIAHELAHVKQAHWADLSFLQLCCALQWFNPFIWLYAKAIKQNHEFLADAAVLAQGNSPARYRAALINHSLQTRVFSFANSFASADQFTRISMMMKTNSNPLKKSAVLLILPALALFLYAFAEPQYTMVETKTPQVGSKNKSIIQQLRMSTHAKPGNSIKSTVVQKQQQSMAGNTPKILRVVTVQNQSAQALSITVHTDSVQKDKMSVTSSPTQISILNRNGAAATVSPLIILDGVKINSLAQIKPDDIQRINVLKGETAVEKYGVEATNGVVEVHTKKAEMKP